MGFRVDERFYGGQRRESRKTINREFESVEAFIVEYVQNISKSGVFIKSKDPLPVGTTVNLKFSVVMDDLETLEGLGKVVRSIKPGGRHTPGMGVIFTELNHYSSKLLEKILARP
jgi:uncharacterized protein (TIGR02266 family)